MSLPLSIQVGLDVFLPANDIESPEHLVQGRHTILLNRVVMATSCRGDFPQ